jgi:hypothetical protein
MPEHAHYDDDALVNVETRHEESDVDVRALLIFLVVCVAFAIVTHLMLYGMFRFFVRMENGRVAAPMSDIQRPPNANMPVEPRLQPFDSKDKGIDVPPNLNTPVTDMAAMRTAEDRTLNHYGWVDQKKGVVHVPIEQAKKMLLQRGLPVVSPPTSSTAPPPTPPAPAGVAPDQTQSGTKGGAKP